MTSDEYDQISRLNNELLNAQRELHRKNRELEALNREKNEAIGVVAHDLRNPINLVHMCTSALTLDAGKLDGEQAELVGMIREAADFMKRMVADVLDLAAIESGTLRLEREPLDLGPYVARSVENNRVLARNADVPVLFELPAAPVPVELDTVRFNQVLNNLIGNAVAHSPAGSPVEVGIDVQPDGVRLTIGDRGPGIPPEKLDTLFRPFVRGDSPNRRGTSVGLGLAIVKRIVEGHGGRITVESVPGRGTTFMVHLPPLSSSV